MTSKLKSILASLATVFMVATLTFAFTGPTNGPSDSDSSSNSVIEQMAYKSSMSSFDRTTDSLEALREKLDAIPTITCAYEAAGATDCNGGKCGGSAVYDLEFTAGKICQDKGYDWASSWKIGAPSSAIYYWDGNAWVYNASTNSIDYVHCCKQ